MLTKADAYDFNHKLFIWALSVIQPASPDEVTAYLSIILKDNGLLPTKDKIDEYFKALASSEYINQVSKKNNLYSISMNGNEQLSPELKKLRDKLRIYLLDKTRVISKVKVLASTESKKMGGASPSSQLRFVLKEVPHPSVPWALGALPNHPRNTWVRIAEQINFGSMLSEASNAETHVHQTQHTIFPLNYCSYNSLDYNLIGNTGPTILASLIGVSPHLIAIMSMAPDKYYRSFKLNKKSGGHRDILAPRKFMKVIQYWITDYFLFRLKTHASCYSYRKGVSIKDNALNHLNNEFIANIDVIDFFGTINKDMVQKCLVKNKIDLKLATAITEMVTFKGFLPQGAPSSPQISNAILFEFDNKISEACFVIGCIYTRYADDITISGSNRNDVIKMVKSAMQLLNDFGFSVNDKKTRISSKNSRQIVTGILVNDVIRPTRKYRKRVRSAFDHALKDNDYSKETIYKLSGYLNYLKSFQQYGYEVNTIQYELTLKYLKRNNRLNKI